MEYAIGVYRVDAGITTCLVGFLPATMVPLWRTFEDGIAQVLSITDNSTSYGSCDAIMLPQFSGIKDMVDGNGGDGDLPEIGSRMVEDHEAHFFFGNKDAVKFLINTDKKQVKKRKK